ncbi:hypothetical protein ASC93_14825 [Massilia sp. Root335]|nr:hypothetical protein ASC93_14825 [Massilia sp. Root335]
MSQSMTQRLEAIALQCARHNPNHISQLHFWLVERPQEGLIAISNNQLRGPSMTIKFTLPRVEEYDARNSLGGPVSDRQQFVQSGLQTTHRKPDLGSCRTRGCLASQSRHEANGRIRARKISCTDSACVREKPVVKLTIGNSAAMQLQGRFVVKAPVHGSCRCDQPTVAFHAGVPHPDADIRLDIADEERTGSSPVAPNVAERTIRMSGTCQCLDSEKMGCQIVGPLLRQPETHGTKREERSPSGFTGRGQQDDATSTVQCRLKLIPGTQEELRPRWQRSPRVSLFPEFGKCTTRFA